MRRATKEVADHWESLLTQEGLGVVESGRQPGRGPRSSLGSRDEYFSKLYTLVCNSLIRETIRYEVLVSLALHLEGFSNREACSILGTSEAGLRKQLSPYRSQCYKSASEWRKIDACE